METQPLRKWYQKKRYIIPGIIIAGSIGLASISEPQSSTTTVNNQLDLQSIQEAPQNTAPEVSNPSSEVELKETTPTLTPSPQPKPNPTPTKKPQPTPTPALNPTPVQKIAPTPSPSPTPASSNCDPNYSGGCVPIASDVDCFGGSGNGPAYFRGTAIVVGSDIYDLDRDNDGIACE